MEYNTAVGSECSCQDRKTLETNDKADEFHRNDIFCTKEIQEVFFFKITKRTYAPGYNMPSL